MTNEKSISQESAVKKQVSALYEIMKNEKLEELEIEEDGFYIHLKRKGKAAPVAVRNENYASPVVQVSEEQAVPVYSGECITSPIMGVFYRTPSPNSKSFVSEGDVVSAGKTLCIVEAMKVMNEIKAEFKVKIVKILVENGNPVTTGQELFQIEKVN